MHYNNSNSSNSKENSRFNSLKVKIIKKKKYSPVSGLTPGVVFTLAEFPQVKYLRIALGGSELIEALNLETLTVVLLDPSDQVLKSYPATIELMDWE